MSIGKQKICTLTLNVRGIVSASKRRKIFLWLKNQKANIMFLQETHSTKSNEIQFKNSWYGKSWFGASDSPHSKGVGILLSNTSEIEFISSHDNNDGRSLLLNININGSPFTLVNVYAPNDISSRIKYFNNLLEWIRNKAHYINNLINRG